MGQSSLHFSLQIGLSGLSSWSRSQRGYLLRSVSWWWRIYLIVLCLVAQLCPTLCDPIDCSSPGFSVHGDFPSKNTGVGCHDFLQGIFTTQGLNSGLPCCGWILYQLSHKGSPPGKSLQRRDKVYLRKPRRPLHDLFVIENCLY